VDEVKLGRVFLQIFLSPLGITQTMLHTHHRRYVILVNDGVIK